MAEIPYPPVFRDWRPDRRDDGRVSARTGDGGVQVEMLIGRDRGAGVWKHVELTERDACLLAAQLLRCAAVCAPGRGLKKLTRRVLRKADALDRRDGR